MVVNLLFAPLRWVAQPLINLLRAGAGISSDNSADRTASVTCCELHNIGPTETDALNYIVVVIAEADGISRALAITLFKYTLGIFKRFSFFMLLNERTSP